MLSRTLRTSRHWLSRFPEHELASLPIDVGAKAVRGLAEKGDEMSLRIFRQQAIALGRVFSIAAKFTDPDVYFVGGGVIYAAEHFREWFLATVREATDLMVEQVAVAEVALVPDLGGDPRAVRRAQPGGIDQ